MLPDRGRIVSDVATLDGLAEAWDALAAPALSWASDDLLQDGIRSLGPAQMFRKEAHCVRSS